MSSAAGQGAGARPGLVASDVDGTLLDPAGEVTDRTRAAVARVEEAGATFVLVTGRPPRWLAPLREQLAHRGVALCANGAVVYDLHDERVLAEDVLPRDVLDRVVARLREHVPGIAFAVEGTAGFGHEPAYQPRWDLGSQLRVEPLEELLVDPRWKVLVRTSAPGATSDLLLSQVRAAVGDAVHATHSAHDDDDALVEISAAGVTKGAALARFAERLGVAAADVVAFGDMPNDLPMLAWAGRGYAMGNAHPEVLATADEVAPSNAEDGVAQVLERLFP